LGGLQFAAGETFDSVAKGESTSALPEKEADPNATVKVSVSLQAALEQHPTLQEGTLSIKPAKQKPGKPPVHYICYDGVDDAAMWLNAVLVDLGVDQHMLTKDKYPKTNAQGAFTAIESEILENVVTVEMPAGKAKLQPEPTPSLDNWETMPDDYPKVLVPGKLGAVDLADYLKAAPIGTAFSGAPDKIYVKTDLDKFKVLGTSDPNDPEHVYKKSVVGAWVALDADDDKAPLTVYPPGTNLQAAILPYDKPAPPPGKTEEEQKAEAEAKAKAKAMAEWVKKHPSVTKESDLFILSHLQNHYDLYGLEPGTYAKKSGKSVLLGHKENPEEFKKLIQDLKIKGKWVDTPAGEMFKATIAQIQKALPGDPAATIKGPDGKEYPKGTKFEEKTTEYTAKDLLPNQSGFHKIVEHEDDPNLMVLKVSGNGETQVQQMKDMVKALNLETPFPEPIKGQYNVIHMVTKESLNKVNKTETEMVVTEPETVPGFVQASLPGTSIGKLWQEVGDNYDDLNALDAIKIPYFGHQIRMGAPGVLRNFGLKVRKIKTKSGKIVYEFSGDLAHVQEANFSEDLFHGAIPFISAAGTVEPVTGWTVHSYDEEGGFHDESKAGGTVQDEDGVKGNTAEGSRIELITHGNTFRGHFRIRVAEGSDMEAELGEAFQKMGYDPKAVLSRTNKNTDRIYKKMCLVKSGMGAKGWSYDHDFDHKKAHDEEYLDAQLKKLKLTKYAKTAKIQSVFQGNSTVIVDDAERFKKAGWQFPYVGASLDGSFMNIFQGAGWSSRKERYVMGSYQADMSMIQTGMSADSDVTCGGAQGTFFRVATDKIGLSSSYNVKLIGKPKLFKRADWWRYDSDAFGTTSMSTPGGTSIASTKKRTETGVTQKTNEIIFEHGVAVEDFLGMVVDSEHEAKSLKDKFKQKGITEIAGKSLDDFIKVITTSAPSTKQIMDTFKISPEDWET